MRPAQGPEPNLGIPLVPSVMSRLLVSEEPVLGSLGETDALVFFGLGCCCGFGYLCRKPASSLSKWKPKDGRGPDAVTLAGHWSCCHPASGEIGTSGLS